MKITSKTEEPILELVEKIWDRALSSNSILEWHSVLEMLVTLNQIHKCPYIESLIKKRKGAIYESV